MIPPYGAPSCGGCMEQSDSSPYSLMDTYPDRIRYSYITLQTFIIRKTNNNEGWLTGKQVKQMIDEYR